MEKYEKYRSMKFSHKKNIFNLYFNKIIIDYNTLSKIWHQLCFSRMSKKCCVNDLTLNTFV